MLTGVRKLMVDAIMLACWSFINFGHSNGSLHACNLLVIAWHCNNNSQLFPCTSQIILHEQWVFDRFYKGVRVKFHIHRPRLYATKFGLQCGLSWQSICWVTCTYVTFCSYLSKENIGMLTFLRWGRLYSAHHFMSFCWVGFNYCEYQ